MLKPKQESTLVNSYARMLFKLVISILVVAKAQVFEIENIH